MVTADGRLTDWVSIGVLTASVPRHAVDDAIAAAGRGARRSDGKLPPHVMVYLVMALALFAGVISSGLWGVNDVTDEGHLSGMRRVVDSYLKRCPRRTRSGVTHVTCANPSCRCCSLVLLLPRAFVRYMSTSQNPLPARASPKWTSDNGRRL